jgi:hypothetical protein
MGIERLDSDDLPVRGPEVGRRFVPIDEIPGDTLNPEEALLRKEVEWSGKLGGGGVDDVVPIPSRTNGVDQSLEDKMEG